MKKIIIAAVIVVVALGAGIYYYSTKPQAPTCLSLSVTCLLLNPMLAELLVWLKSTPSCPPDLALKLPFTPCSRVTPSLVLLKI